MCSSNCIHHWIIEPPHYNGDAPDTSVGECKLCGVSKVFSNAEPVYKGLQIKARDKDTTGRHMGASIMSWDRSNK